MAGVVRESPLYVKVMPARSVSRKDGPEFEKVRSRMLEELARVQVRSHGVEQTSLHAPRSPQEAGRQSAEIRLYWDYPFGYPVLGKADSSDVGIPPWGKPWESIRDLKFVGRKTVGFKFPSGHQ